MTPAVAESTDFISVLKKVSIFSELAENAEALTAILNMLEKKSFKAESILIKEGDPGEEFFILLKGKVAIARTTPEGEMYKVVVLDGDNNPAFGEGGLIEGEKRSATVFAETDCDTLVLSLQKFTEFAAIKPEYAYPILKKIAQNLMGRLNQTSRDLMLLHKALMDEIRSN